jgi:antitoxin component of MazEF toxin-antitoxin module
MRYRTTIAGTGTNTTGIPVPEDVMTALGAGRKPAVTVTLDGYTYRSSVGTVDGAPMISLSAANREAAGVKAGDEVEVEVALDTAPREVSVPDDFAAALDAEPAARRTFDALSYSNRRWHVDSVTGAKTDETRQRRIAKSVDMLREGRAR